MSDFLRDALSALPTVATSSLALVGYLLVLLSWLLIALRVKRHKNLLKNLSQLPLKDRLEALQSEMGTPRIKGGITPDQWLRSRIHFYYLLAFGMLCVLVLVLFAIASQTRVARVPAKVEIVDASIEDQADLKGFPILDIKLRNIGDEVAFLKKATFVVTEVFNLESPNSYEEFVHMPITWNYNIELPLERYPYSKEVTLSQVIRGRDVDRFTFSLAPGSGRRVSFDLRKALEEIEERIRRLRELEKTEPGASPLLRALERSRKLPLNAGTVISEWFSIIRMQVDIIYNEDDKQISTGPMIFVLPQPRLLTAALVTPKPNSKEIAEENNRKLLQARELDGKKTTSVVELLKQAR